MPPTYIDLSALTDGGAKDAWASPLNSNLTALDTGLQAAQARADAAFALAGSSSGGGVSLPYMIADTTADLGPQAQTAYDSKQYRGLWIPRGSGSTLATPTWNTSMFIDENQPHRGFEIAGAKGVIISLGTGLRTSSWSRDTTTKFAVFSNVSRTSGTGSVTLSDSTRATGSGGALRSLVVRDITISGGGANVGFVYSNRTAVTAENVIIVGMRCFGTHWDYTDGNVFIGCHSRAGGYSGSQYFYIQTEAGDGLVVLGGKADSTVGFLDLSRCRGGIILGLVTASVKLTDCSGIVGEGCHQEGQQSGQVMWTLNGVQSLTLTQGMTYEPWDNTSAGIVINDLNASRGTTLILEGHNSGRLFQTTNSNAENGPFIRIDSVQDNTTIIARNVQGLLTSNNTAGQWMSGGQPKIASSISAVTTALSTAKARSLLASGNWTLSRASHNGGWRIDGETEQFYVSKAHAGSPSILQALVGLTGVTGVMTNGTVYSYAVYGVNAQGNRTAVSAEVSATVGSALAVRLRINTYEADGLVVLRKAGAGAATTPDSYVALPVLQTEVNLYDLGTWIDGRPWAAWSGAGLTVPTSNATSPAAIVLNDTTVITS